MAYYPICIIKQTIPLRSNVLFPTLITIGNGDVVIRVS